jgi:hypothetical protein
MTGWKYWAIATALLVLVAASFGAGLAQDVPRMGINELKARLGDPNTVIIDVRRTGDWSGSEDMVAGAVREDPFNADSWAKDYSKEKTIVLYCG